MTLHFCQLECLTLPCVVLLNIYHAIHNIFLTCTFESIWYFKFWWSLMLCCVVLCCVVSCCSVVCCVVV